MPKAQDKNIFATSRTDNDAMHRSLERSGFVRDGKPYASDRRPDKLQLFVRVNAQPALEGTKGIQAQSR